MKITAARLLRWAGLAAIGAGSLFILIQLIHPPETLASVTTGRWAAVHIMTLSMALFALIGVTGIYTAQIKEAGWLGLAGFCIFGLFWVATTAFTFVEAFILPLLATDAPRFVEGYLGIFSGHASGADLGALPAVGPIGGGLYMIGGLLFGIAMFRAGILPRWAAGLLAIGAVLTLSSPLLGHPLDRLLAVPMGTAFIGLGYALWTNRRGESPA